MLGKRDKYLIITADDFGYSDPRDDGIIECFKSGAVSNSSLMVNGLSAENAVQKANKVGLPMGLHLNLTEGLPVSGSNLKSLVGSDGFMLGKMGLREAVNVGHVNMAEVVTEIQAQIDKYESLTGRKPLNVDGHQHIHVFPGICEVFAKTLCANGIKLTRLPIEDNIENTNWDMKKFLFKSTLIQQAREAVEIFWKSEIWAPSFTGLKTMGAGMTVQTLQDSIQEGFKVQTTPKYRYKSPAPSCELMVHPGKQTGNSGGCGNGPDGFSQSEDRPHEMKVLQSEEMRNFYSESNINLISFEDLSHMAWS